MKKLIYAATAMIMAVSANAQLKVTTSGEVQIGTAPGSSSIVETTDTMSMLRIYGPASAQTGGYITFGKTGAVSIGESAVTSSSGVISTAIGNPRLMLNGAGGFHIKAGPRSILYYDPTMLTIGASGAALISSLPVSAPQYLTTSDERAKTDIEPLDDLGLLLGELAPVSYTLIQDDEGESGESQENSPRRSAPSESSGQHQYGFLAQDVREVYPELVYEDSEGMLSIDYTGFIAILVNAVQNLQTEVKAQAETIKTLQEGPQDGDTFGNGDAVVASLSQNRPNPFRTTTVIDCTIPEDATEAFICVYDLNGNQKRHINIADRGETGVSIEGNTLEPGMYIYTLIVDGNEIGSKRMILTD